MHALAEPSPDLARKSVPWIFYGQTTSLCETCWELVPAKIIGQDGKVFYQKRCPEHGVMKTLIEEDADYWLNDPPLAEARRPAAVQRQPDRARLPVGLRPLPRSRAA